jgi:hypothetical protein
MFLINGVIACLAGLNVMIQEPQPKNFLEHAIRDVQVTVVTEYTYWKLNQN